MAVRTQVPGATTCPYAPDTVITEVSLEVYDHSPLLLDTGGDSRKSGVHKVLSGTLNPPTVFVTMLIVSEALAVPAE